MFFGILFGRGQRLMTVVLLFLGINLVLFGLFDWKPNLNMNWFDDLFLSGQTMTVRGESASGYDYLIRLPKNYREDDPPRPLLLFLHGAGEVGSDVSVLEKLDAFYYAKRGITGLSEKSFPFIVVSPLTPKHGWDPKKVVLLLDELLQSDRCHIDPERVYLTGFSMGGFGTFRVASEYPERFTAIVPLAGGGESANAVKLQNMPTWVFHGDLDTALPIEYSKIMVEALKNAGNQNLHFTVLKGYYHQIPKKVYKNRELYKWLLQQKIQPTTTDE